MPVHGNAWSARRGGTPPLPSVGGVGHGTQEARHDQRILETVIIGAGTAGPSTGYHLRKRGRTLVILDGNAIVGDNWREQWDTPRLYTPRSTGPGLPFPGERWSFPGKDEVARYLESYAVRWDLSVRMSTRVDTVDPQPGGGFRLDVGGNTITCDNVVVATGTFGRTPAVPRFAGDLDPSIRQLHSSEYRRPSQLQDGPVDRPGEEERGHQWARRVDCAEQLEVDRAQRLADRLEPRPMHWVDTVAAGISGPPARSGITLRRLGAGGIRGEELPSSRHPLERTVASVAESDSGSGN